MRLFLIFEGNNFSLKKNETKWVFLRLKEIFWLIQNECFPVCISERKEKIIQLWVDSEGIFFQFLFSIKQKKVILFAQFCTQIQMEPAGETGAQHL